MDLMLGATMRACADEEINGWISDHRLTLTPKKMECVIVRDSRRSDPVMLHVGRNRDSPLWTCQILECCRRRQEKLWLSFRVR